jgi:hypothetical protein
MTWESLRAWLEGSLGRCFGNTSVEYGRWESIHNSLVASESERQHGSDGPVSSVRLSWLEFSRGAEENSDSENMSMLTVEQTRVLSQQMRTRGQSCASHHVSPLRRRILPGSSLRDNGSFMIRPTEKLSPSAYGQPPAWSFYQAITFSGCSVLAQIVVRADLGPHIDYSGHSVTLTTGKPDAANPSVAPSAGTGFP